MTRLVLLPAILLFLHPVHANSFSQSWIPPSVRQLPGGDATSIERDKNGILWIGTKEGLTRFNGSTYKPFILEDNDNVSGFEILDLCYDKYGLWVLSDKSLCLLSEDSLKTELPLSNLPRAFCKGAPPENELIFSDNEGLKIYNKSNLTLTHIIHDIDVARSPHILACRDGSIWASTAEGLKIFGNDYSLQDQILVDSEVTSLYETSAGTLLAGTENGLYQYSTRTRQNIPLDDTIHELTAGQHILFLQKNDNAGSVIGIKGRGIYSINPDGNEIYRIWTDELLEDSESCICYVDDDIIALAKDAERQIYVKSRSRIYNIYAFSENKADLIIGAFNLAEDQLLIVGSERIRILNLKENSSKDITPPPYGANPKSSNALLDSRGVLWIVHDNDFLARYTISDGSIHETKGYHIKGISCLWETPDGEVSVIGKDGMHTFYPEGDKKKRPISRAYLFKSSITTEDKSTYFLSDNDLYYLGLDGSINPLGLNIESPTCVSKAGDEVIWIGTYNSGIMQYNENTHEVSWFTAANGLPSNSIRSLMSTEDGVWICTRNNISYFNKKIGNLVVFDLPFGISSEFKYGAHCLQTPDKVYFPFGNRLVSLMIPTAAPSRQSRIELDAVLVNNEPREPIHDEMVFTHKDNQIVFYYSASDFSFGLRRNYQYMLQGYDKDWVLAGDNTRAPYANLKRGRYTFLVRTQNEAGTWDNPGLYFNFRVKPSPWLSTGAIIAYISLSFAILYITAAFILKYSRTRHRLEEEKKERLLTARLDKEKTYFFTNIAHEYRTPIALIYGPVKELASDGSLNRRNRELVKIITRSVERLDKLTKVALTFQDNRRADGQFRPASHDLAAHIRSLIADFDYLFVEKGLHFSMQAPESLILDYDKDIIEKVLFNLLSNAVKYTPKEGDVSVNIVAAGDTVSIEVADTGIGVNDSMKARIFSRFEREGRLVGNGIPPGFGIGLDYAQHLAKIHSGKIEVKNNIPHGSIFTFSFPANFAACRQSCLTEAKPPIHDKEDNRIKILAVEDNEDMRKYLEMLLKNRNNYDVSCCPDGASAIESFSSEMPDLVISDVMMPIKDGFSLCHDIKANPESCHIPVILLTAKADETSKIQGTELGADAYIPKPFDPDYLIAVITNILDNRRRIQTYFRRITQQRDADCNPIKEETTNEANIALISEKDKRFIENLYAIINENIGDEGFNISCLPAKLAISRTGMFSKIKALLGCSPQELLEEYRLNKAMEILKSCRDITITEIAETVGYSSIGSFSRAFKQKFGCAPSKMRSGQKMVDISSTEIRERQAAGYDMGRFLM